MCDCCHTYSVSLEFIIAAAHRQAFWSTAGGLLAAWEMSGAVRGTMDVLDRVYGTHSERSFWRRMAVSIGLAAALIVLLLGAAAVMELAPRLAPGAAVAIARWPVTVALLWAAITLNFLIPRLMPGNAAIAMMARYRGHVNPQALHALVRALRPHRVTEHVRIGGRESGDVDRDLHELH